MWSTDERNEYERGIEEGLSGNDFTDGMDDGARFIGSITFGTESREYLDGVERGREIRSEREASAKGQASSSSGGYYCSGGSYESSGKAGDWLSAILLLVVLAFVGAVFVGKPVGFLLFLVCFVWLVVRSARNK